MRVRFFAALIPAFAILAAKSAFGQANAGTVTIPHPGPAERLPYTAEFRVTLVKTLADGATITRKATKRQAADSQGRVMTAQTQSPVSGEGETITHVTVVDPIAGDFMHWSLPDAHAIATVNPMIGIGAHACKPAPAATRFEGGPVPTELLLRDQGPKPTVEDLGTDTIQGIEVRGSRITRIAVGNSRNNEPLVIISEMWTPTNPGYVGLVAKQITDDPRAGRTTTELVNFVQGEPDESEFRPPAGYEVVTQQQESADCGTLPTSDQPSSGNTRAPTDRTQDTPQQ